MTTGGLEKLKAGTWDIPAGMDVSGNGTSSLYQILEFSRIAGFHDDELWWRAQGELQIDKVTQEAPSMWVWGGYVISSGLSNVKSCNRDETS